MTLDDLIPVFCIGAAKCGTSWLHESLSDHPQAQFRSIKELHYFNTLQDKPAWVRDSFLRRIESARRKHDRNPTPESAARLADLTGYLRVFDGDRGSHTGYCEYLSRGAKPGQAVGDFTPAYGLLDQPLLIDMAGLSPNSRFIYLMRDPVDRLWSHLRMHYKRRHGEEFDEVRMRVMANELLEGKNLDLDSRGRYADTVDKLDHANLVDRSLVVFYEDLMSGSGVDRILQFLGITPFPFDTERRVNQSISAPLPNDLAERFREYLDPEYSRMEARFPGRLPASWRLT